MSFDLLDNPFAILGLPIDADLGAITARARELGHAEAAGASRVLLSPRTRLPAELSFLPGAGAEAVAACLAALRAGADPDIAALSPIAIANVLAHRMAAGTAADAEAPVLLALQLGIADAAPAVLEAARRAAGMPAPGPLEAALDTLADGHATALAAFAAGRPGGSAMLCGLIELSGQGITPMALFMRRVVGAWDRARADIVAITMEEAEQAEADLTRRADTRSAGRLAALIGPYAAQVRPNRALAALFGTTHEPSATAESRWRALACDLAMEHQASAEAVTVLEALAAGFGTAHEEGQRVQRDLDAARVRTSSAEDTPTMQRLLRAIDHASQQPGLFQSHGMVDGTVTFASPPVVVALHNAFLAAAETAETEAPWALLRAFYLRLLNEWSAPGAALSFAMLAVRLAADYAAAKAIRRTLDGDLRLLRRRISPSERAKVETPPPEASPAARRKGRVAGRWFAFVVVLFIYGTAGGPGLLSMFRLFQPFGTVADTATPQPVPAKMSPTPTALPVVDRSERAPEAGSGTLSLAELRWCRYRRVRAAEAQAYLDQMSRDARAAAAGWNTLGAYVAQTRALCVGYPARTADGLTIDAELTRQDTTLRAEGRRLVGDGALLQPVLLEADSTQPGGQP